MFCSFSTITILLLLSLFSVSRGGTVNIGCSLAVGAWDDEAIIIQQRTGLIVFRDWFPIIFYAYPFPHSSFLRANSKANLTIGGESYNVNLTIMDAMDLGEAVEQLTAIEPYVDFFFSSGSDEWDAILSKLAGSFKKLMIGIFDLTPYFYTDSDYAFAAIPSAS